MIDLSHITHSYGEGTVTFDQVFPFMSASDFIHALYAGGLVHASYTSEDDFSDAVNEVFFERGYNPGSFRPDGILTGMLVHYGGPYFVETGVGAIGRMIDHLRTLFSTNPELFLTAFTVSNLKASDDYISDAGTAKNLYLPTTNTNNIPNPEEVLYDPDTGDPDARLITAFYSTAAVNTMLNSSDYVFSEPHGRQTHFTDPAYVVATNQPKNPTGWKTSRFTVLAANEVDYWAVTLTKSNGNWTGTSFTITVNGVTTASIDASHKLFGTVDNPATPSTNENVANQLRYFIFQALQSIGVRASVFAYSETSTTKVFRIYFHNPAKVGTLWRYPEQSTGYAKPGYYQAEVNHEYSVSFTPSGGLAISAAEADHGNEMDYDWLDENGSVLLDSNGRCQRPVKVTNTFAYKRDLFESLLVEHVARGATYDLVYDDDEDALSYLDAVGYTGGVSRPFHGGGPENSNSPDGSWGRASYRAWWVTTQHFQDLYQDKLPASLVAELAAGNVWDDGRLDSETERTLTEQYYWLWMEEMMQSHIGEKSNEIADVFRVYWPQIKFGSWMGRMGVQSVPIGYRTDASPLLFGYMNYRVNAFRMFGAYDYYSQFGRNINAIPDKAEKHTWHPNSRVAINYAKRDDSGLVTIGTWTEPGIAASSVFVGNDQYWDGVEVGMNVYPRQLGTNNNDTTLRDLQDYFGQPYYTINPAATIPSQPTVWFDADTLSTSLTTWTHSGESGLPSVSSSAKISATGNGSITTVAASLNGHRVVRLVPASSQWLAVNNISAFLNNAYTVVATVKAASGMTYTGGLGGRVLLSTQSSGNADCDVIFVSGSDGYLKHADSTGTVRNLIETDLRGNWHTISLRFLATTIVAYLDGNEEATISVTRASDVSKCSIGQRYVSSTPSDFWDGDIAYVTCYLGDISATNRAATEGFQSWRFGLQANLPVGHPHSGSAPGSIYTKPWSRIVGYPVTAVGHLDESNNFQAGVDAYGHITALQYQDQDRDIPEWAHETTGLTGFSAGKNMYATFVDGWRVFLHGVRMMKSALLASYFPSFCWLAIPYSSYAIRDMEHEYGAEALIHLHLNGVDGIVWYNGDVPGVMDHLDVHNRFNDTMLELENLIGFEETTPLSSNFTRDQLDLQDSDYIISGVNLPGNKKLFRVTWRNHGLAGFDREEGGYCIFTRDDGSEFQIRGTRIASSLNQVGAWVQSTAANAGDVAATVGITASITGSVGQPVDGVVAGAFPTSYWTLTGTLTVEHQTVEPPPVFFVPYYVLLQPLPLPNDVVVRRVTVTQGNTAGTHAVSPATPQVGPFYADVGTRVQVSVVDVDDAGNWSEPTELTVIVGNDLPVLETLDDVAEYVADRVLSQGDGFRLAVIRR